MDAYKAGHVQMIIQANNIPNGIFLIQTTSRICNYK